MAYETLVAVYDTIANAQAASRALNAAGFADSDISIFDRDRLSGIATVTNKQSMWQRLFGTEVYEHEAVIYTQAVERGGAVLTVRVPENEVAHARAVLDVHRPVDVHDRAITAGIAPSGHIETVRERLGDVPLAPGQVLAVNERYATASPEALRLAEEQLEIGKNIVETGRTRVRRFVTEKDVEANVTLHDEHAEVIRKAVTGPAINVDWADEEIEVVETAEHAIVSKTARVVEEIGLQKVGTEHVETIHEKLRRQQVEIERLDSEGKPLAARDIPPRPTR